MTFEAYGQRIAIVTGAARGIGAAVARRLARDGLAVGVIDLREGHCASTVEAIRADGGSAIVVAADVADEAAVTAAVDRIAAELGPPTVLVNNAGIGPQADLVDITTEQWDSVLGVNLRGAFFATRAVSRHMISARWGRIVNLSSVSAVRDAGLLYFSSGKPHMIGVSDSSSVVCSSDLVSDDESRRDGVGGD